MAHQAYFPKQKLIIYLGRTYVVASHPRLYAISLLGTHWHNDEYIHGYLNFLKMMEILLWLPKSLNCKNISHELLDEKFLEDLQEAVLLVLVFTTNC